MRKEHGNHNLDLCKIILDEGGYNDWVVTTAFYSAVHFVEHALFPLIEKNVEYKTFNEYWQNIYSHRHVSKHDCKKKLVNKYIPAVRTEYRELYEDCFSSRYNNYQVNDYNAQQAIKKAHKIKAACLAIKP